MNIEFLLTQPEGKTLEFKRDLSSLKPILKTIVAFANTAGGTLIVGHSPENDAPLIEDILQAEESLANAIADAIRPTLHPEIDIKTVAGKNLLIVRVYHQSGPYHIRSEGMTDGVYVRFGSTTRKASPEIVTDLLRANSHLGFDQTPCADFEEDALDESKVYTFFKQINKDPEDSSVIKAHLQTLGVLIPHGTSHRISNGGLILFGKDELRERYFPDARISCARFQGTDKSHFIDRQDMEGSILDALEPVMKFIFRNTRLSSVIRSLYREDIREYPEIPLREALINAIAHANYAISGRIFVAIYDDRLEIQNSGMLPYGVTLDDFKAGISHIRNKVIARICRELNLIEEWGSGYRRIATYCEKFGYPIPEWQEFGTAIRVIFHPHPMAIGSPIEEHIPGERVTNKENLDLSPRQQEILDILHQEKTMKMREILQKLKSPPAERTLRDDLTFLRENGIIDSKGHTKTTEWFLVNQSE